MPPVELVACLEHERDVLASLLGPYLVELGHDGPYEHLPSYWIDPARSAFFVRANGALAGFVLVNDVTHLNEPVDHAIAELYVMPEHRRVGVGLAAACTTIVAQPGRWEIAVARGNASALGFWRAVIAALGVEARVHDRRDSRWNGWIFRIEIRAAEARSTRA